MEYIANRLPLKAALHFVSGIFVYIRDPQLRMSRCYSRDWNTQHSRAPWGRCQALAADMNIIPSSSVNLSHHFIPSLSQGIYSTAKRNGQMCAKNRTWFSDELMMGWYALFVKRIQHCSRCCYHEREYITIHPFLKWIIQWGCLISRPIILKMCAVLQPR